jgi:hypothetical protein
VVKDLTSLWGQTVSEALSAPLHPSRLKTIQLPTAGIGWQNVLHEKMLKSMTKLFREKWRNMWLFDKC